MDYQRDLNNSRNNKMYYNQLQRANASKRKRRRNNNQSFGSKKVEIEDVIWAPSGYEGFFYFLYFISIPYMVGAIFLFFGVAQADFDSFVKLNMTAFFIVWAIGYEIVASLLLALIFILFLKHDGNQ